MGVSKTFMKYIEHSKNNKKSMNKYYNNLLPISFFSLHLVLHVYDKVFTSFSTSYLYTIDTKTSIQQTTSEQQFH